MLGVNKKSAFRCTFKISNVKLQIHLYQMSCFLGELFPQRLRGEDFDVIVL